MATLTPCSCLSTTKVSGGAAASAFLVTLEAGCVDADSAFHTPIRSREVLSSFVSWSRARAPAEGRRQEGPVGQSRRGRQQRAHRRESRRVIFSGVAIEHPEGVGGEGRGEEKRFSERRGRAPV